MKFSEGAHNTSDPKIQVTECRYHITIFVIGSTKKGLIADPNNTYLETHNLTWEFGTALKLGPIIPLE